MYTLSRFVDTKGKFSKEDISNLSDEDFQLLMQEEKKLLEFFVLKSLFDITELNLKDLQQYVSTFEADLRRDKVLILDEPDRVSLNINRLFLNYVFSYRTYIDHLETFLKRTFGDASNELTTFKKLTAELYDNHFEYRFIYKLRNYAQHCGLPIDVFNINPSIYEGVYDVKINIEFAPNLLLVKFDAWGAQLKKELSELKTNLSVITVANTFLEITKEIQKWFLQIIEPTKDLIKAKVQEISGGKAENFENLCITYHNETNQLCAINSVFRYVTQMERLPLT